MWLQKIQKSQVCGQHLAKYVAPMSLLDHCPSRAILGVGRLSRALSSRLFHHSLPMSCLGCLAASRVISSYSTRVATVPAHSAALPNTPSLFRCFWPAPAAPAPAPASSSSFSHSCSAQSLAASRSLCCWRMFGVF